MSVIYCNRDGATTASGSRQDPTNPYEAARRSAPGDYIFILPDARRSKMFYPHPLIIEGKLDVRAFAPDGTIAVFPQIIVKNCRNVTIDGLAAGDSPGDCIAFVDCLACAAVRCLAFNAAAGNMVYLVNRCKDTTINCCAGWGTGRKIAQAYTHKEGECLNTQWVRCYFSGGNFRGGFGGSGTPSGTLTLQYNTRGVTVQDCVLTWDETGDPPPGSTDGIVFVDRCEKEDKTADILLKDSLVFTLPSQRVTRFSAGIACAGLNNVTLMDSASIMSHAQPPLSLGAKPYGGQNCVAERLFVEGDTYSPINKSVWTPTYTQERPIIPQLDREMCFNMELLGGPSWARQLAELEEILA